MGGANFAIPEFVASRIRNFREAMLDWSGHKTLLLANSDLMFKYMFKIEISFSGTTSDRALTEKLCLIRGLAAKIVGAF